MDTILSTFLEYIRSRPKIMGHLSTRVNRVILLRKCVICTMFPTIVFMAGSLIFGLFYSVGLIYSVILISPLCLLLIGMWYIFLYHVGDLGWRIFIIGAHGGITNDINAAIYVTSRIAGVGTKTVFFAMRLSRIPKVTRTQ